MVEVPRVGPLDKKHQSAESVRAQTRPEQDIAAAGESYSTEQQPSRQGPQADPGDTDKPDDVSCLQACHRKASHPGAVCYNRLEQCRDRSPVGKGAADDRRAPQSDQQRCVKQRGR